MTDENEGAHNQQFPYWLHIPNLFKEIENHCNAEVDDIKLHELVLQKLWDRYRTNTDFIWIDRRIRAESSGVALSAHSGIAEIDLTNPDEAKGIKRLAQTILSAITLKLKHQYQYDLPDKQPFEDLILGTIIKDYGAISYECSLETADGSKIFRGHCYFGMKPNIKTNDCFQHIKLYTGWCSELEQLKFILEHLNHDEGKSKRSSLFG